MTHKPDMLLWLSDARGIYIPQNFANSFADRAKSVEGVSDENWAILEAGPDHEWYWDTWTEVCDRAEITDKHGNKYHVWQEGDCWLVPVGMEWNDETETFAWPNEKEGDE